MCGEKAWVGESKNNNTGSPPHVRGKAFTPRWYAVLLRITPACAGKSTAAAAVLAPGRDHPRMCGEKTKKIP